MNEKQERRIRHRLESGLLTVLKAEKERYDSILDNEDIDALLLKEPRDRSSNQTCDSAAYVPRESIIGYPDYPLYRHLSEMLFIWVKTGKCPIFTLPRNYLLDEIEHAESRTVRLDFVKLLLNGLVSFIDMWTIEEINFRIREILLALDKRGILDLLGMRKTVSTVDTWPPSRKTLLDTVNSLHTPASKLTVAARALAKHSHRDGTSSWWGVCTGSDGEKNEHAVTVVNKILDGATWINIHQIVHDVLLLEVRQASGYGVRWLADGTSFRGFLEPQMLDGHSVGWKH